MSLYKRIHCGSRFPAAFFPFFWWTPPCAVTQLKRVIWCPLFTILQTVVHSHALTCEIKWRKGCVVDAPGLLLTLLSFFFFFLLWMAWLRLGICISICVIVWGFSLVIFCCHVSCFHAFLLATAVVGSITLSGRLVSFLHSCERDVSGILEGNLFKFGTNIHLGELKDELIRFMNWLDFGGQKSLLPDKFYKY